MDSEQLTGARLSESLMSRNNSTSAYDDKSVARDVWVDVFPCEIIFLRAMITNKILLNVLKLFFTLCTVGLIGYAAVLIDQSKYLDPDLPLSLIFVLHVEVGLIVVIPCLCFWFTKRVTSNPDVNSLIVFAIQFDTQVKFKFAIITHLNTFCLLMGMFLYIWHDWENDFHLVITILMTCTYFGPVNVAVSLAICVVELHRIKIQHFRCEVNKKRTRLEAQFWNQRIDFIDGNDNGHGNGNGNGNGYNNDEEKNDNEDPIRESAGTASVDYISDDSVRELRHQYYKIYALCSRSSESFGLYLLFFLCFGVVYAFGTIYSIYLKQYPSQGLIGFVVVGIVTVLGLAVSLAVCNETGRMR